MNVAEALAQLKDQVSKYELAIKALEGLSSTNGTVEPKRMGKLKRHGMSAAGRAAIAAAQRKRWALARKRSS